jgi:glycosyltransferase 2 family protein
LSLKKWPVRLAQIAVLLVIGYYLIWRNLVLNWHSLSAYTWDISWWPFWLSLLGNSAAFTFNAQIWRMMVRVMGGVSVRPLRAAYIWFVSSLGRYLPGKVWQIAGMALLARRDGVGAVDSTACAVLNQVLHLLAGAAVGLVFLPAGLSGYLGAAGRWAWLAVPIILICLWPPLLNRLLALAARLSGKPGVQCRMNMGHLFLWFGLNVLVWIVYGVCFHYFILAVVPDCGLSMGTAAGIYAVSYVAGFLVLIAPGGLGVRESLITVFLAGTLGEARATVIALVSRLWLTMAELVPLGVLLAVEGLPGRAVESGNVKGD